MRSATAILAVLLAASACRREGAAGAIIASGHVEATEVHLSTKVAGRLESFPLREGDHVAAGQEIARQEAVDAELARRQAEAERAQAEAELRLRVAGARREDIAEAENQAAAMRVELEAAERDRGRQQALLDRGSGTAKARDDARTRRDAIAARLAALEEALSRLRAGSRAEEIDAARARVAATEARAAQYAQRIADATVVSPVAGIVTEKLAEAGELLQPGSPLAVVTDLADAWLTVYVGEPDLGRLRIGQEAEVVTDGGERRRGRVTFVASQAEFTPKNVQTRDERVKLVFKVKVSLDNADGLFKPGMPAEARLAAAGDAR
jgi:HlyD family secretion protein